MMRRMIISHGLLFCMLIHAVAAQPARAGAASKVADGAPATSAATDDDDPYGSQAATYDSNYTHGTKGSAATGNTPEDDARPGVYYFGVGVNAFQHKDYRFAVEMYQVAASWAYKPAEYNLAVMYARGQGIPVDIPRAMAWMTLAAERNDPRYVQARELIRSQLGKDQLDGAETILADLKKTYGDETALRRAKARWAEVRNNVTGSHVGFAGNLTVGGASPGIAPAPQRPPPKSTRGGGASGATTAGDVAGAEVINGATAYHQLRESDNPYDPKFERQPAGTATVEPLIPVKQDAAGGTKAGMNGDSRHDD